MTSLQASFQKLFTDSLEAKTGEGEAEDIVWGGRALLMGAADLSLMPATAPGFLRTAKDES